MQRTVVLCAICLVLNQAGLGQVMNVQTNSGITSFGLSDIINITFSDKNTSGTVADIDGNTYRTVKIGDQVWMAENLKVTHYRDGADILEEIDKNVWNTLFTGAYCYYDNEKANRSDYGCLYNWYAISSSHNLAPEGWHVPSKDEWDTLVDSLGGQGIAGSQLKESGNSHWVVHDNGGNNESGFTALPGGYRFVDGIYNHKGYSAEFWSSTPVQEYMATNVVLSYSSTAVENYSANKRTGYSVRCVRDN